MHAIVVTEPGDADVLAWQEVPDPVAGPGQVLIDVKACGVNYPDVLIIEDEAIISADIQSLVKELGHRVTGTATTHDEAVDAVARHRPGLVLADIQLADGSSGIDAVKDILKDIDVPVIFITAFPERLLTGERPEPTFLITNPFQPETVKAAISQALFFHPSRHKEAA